MLLLANVLMDLLHFYTHGHVIHVVIANYIHSHSWLIQFSVYYKYLYK